MNVSMIQDLYLSSFVMTNLRFLIDLYYGLLKSQSTKSGNDALVPSQYVLVRACGLFMYASGLRTVVGRYLIVGDSGEINSTHFSIAAIPHTWLMYGSDIIDVIPVNGKFGISVPQILFASDLPNPFSPSVEIYPEGFGKGMRRKADEEVEALVLVFESIMRKVVF
jgi:hypothetical protein